MAGYNGLECFVLQREKSLRARLPEDARLHINDIRQCCEDLDPKYIKGTIISPPVYLKNIDKQIEFAIKDESLPDGRSIKVHLVGSIVNDFPSEVVGNVIHILNCSIVEENSSVPHSHKFQLYCNSNVNLPRIRLFRKTADAANQENKGSLTKKAKDCGYTLIKDLQVGTSVNLYGVVKAFKDARKSNGEDYYSNVLLVDESGEEISCNLFSSNSGWLPKITSVGDILRLHRVKIKSHCGNNQGVGTQKWGCSSVVFDGNCGTEFTPRASSASFQFNDYDKKRVSELRDWAAQQDELHTCIKLSSIARDLKFNLICQVVSVSIDQDNLRAYLGVWDGTKTNVNVRIPEQAEEVRKRTSVDHELEASIGDMIANITIYDDHVVNVRNIKCRDFVRLQNVHASGCSDDGVDLCIHRGQAFGRGVFKCSPTDLDVLNLRKLLDGIIDKQQQMLTSETLHPDVPFSTIAEMNNQNVLLVPHKHHLKVQVTQVFPPDITKMVKLYCPKCKSKYDMCRGDYTDSTRVIHDAGEQCPLCAPNNSTSSSSEATPPKLKYAYRMELRLEDYTGVINAYLIEEDAAVMFPDLPATNLFLDHPTRNALCEKLTYLCGGTNPFNTPVASMKPYSRPWLNCCVKSYYIGGKPKNPTDKCKIAYRIFDTILNS